MQAIDYAKAVGVVVAVLAITVAASFPMVAFYAYFVEPGHPQEFYNEAAQWIAPWSSYILGPPLYFVFNYWLAKRTPSRNAIAFAAMTVVFYIALDVGAQVGLANELTLTMGLTMAASIATKAIGAFLGAHFGSRSSRTAAESAV